MTTYEEQLAEAKAEMLEIAEYPRWNQVRIIWENMTMPCYEAIKDFWMNQLTDSEKSLLPALDAAYRCGHADGCRDYPPQH